MIEKAASWAPHSPLQRARGGPEMYSGGERWPALPRSIGFTHDEWHTYKLINDTNLFQGSEGSSHLVLTAPVSPSLPHSPGDAHGLAACAAWTDRRTDGRTDGQGPTCHFPGRGQPRGGLQVGGDGAAGLQGADQLSQPLALLPQLLSILVEPLPRRAGRVQAQVQHLGSALVVVTLRDHRQEVRAAHERAQRGTRARPAGSPPLSLGCGLS